MPGKKRERYSILGGLIGKKFISPFIFQGGCNSEVFNAWFEKILIPALPKDATIILDNAAFHKTDSTKKIAEKYGFHLLYLPPYSPDMNPIEHCWHTLKSKLRPLIQFLKSDFQQVIGGCLLTM